MSQPFLGEIRMFGGNYAPNGWAFCNGALLAISQFDALYSLIGTTYGGDGVTTFALPDLRGRLPVHQGPAFVLGQAGGVETVTLTSATLPSHSHLVAASTAVGTQSGPQGGVLAQSTVAALYYEDLTNVTLDPSSITSAGGNQPHDNFQPYLCIAFIMALFGVYPSQN